MTIDELVAREGIRDLVARYAHCADKGKFDELALLFTADGVLDAGEGRVLTGRDALRGFVSGQKRDLSAKTTSSLVRHHVSNLRIDLDSADAARGVAYFLVITDRGPDHWGQYRDAYRREGDRWLFAERRVKLEGWGENSWVGARRRQ